MNFATQQSSLWLLVSDILGRNPTPWEDDSIWLAANWGYCYRDGKHPLTTHAEWKVLKHRMEQGPNYTKQGTKELFFLLCEKRFELFIKLFYDF